MKYEQPEMNIITLVQECICNVSVGGDAGEQIPDSSVGDDMFAD